MADRRIHLEVRVTGGDPRFTPGWRERSKFDGVIEGLDTEVA